jgi:hypothetical protein
VPSEQATRELAEAVLVELQNRLTTLHLAKSYETLRNRIPELLAYENEASYISDRLHAVLRKEPDERPLITIYGESLSDHSILGSAIQIAGDDAIHPLFPLSLLREVPGLIEKTISAPTQARREPVDTGGG